MAEGARGLAGPDAPPLPEPPPVAPPAVRAAPAAPPAPETRVFPAIPLPPETPDPATAIVPAPDSDPENPVVVRETAGRPETASRVPVPKGLKLTDDRDPEAILGAFLGIPYRPDGAVDEKGDFVLWSRPETVFKSPGLNCSGFLVAAARLLTGENFSLEDARRDPGNDSHPGSEFGEDWDFGLDVVLNLLGGNPRLVPRDGETTRRVAEDGKILGLGANIHSPAFKEALDLLNPEKIHFFAISKPDRRFPGGVSYYHNGIVLPGKNGELWFYHATNKGGVNRMNLRGERGFANFLVFYPPVRGRGERKILFAEAENLPAGGKGTPEPHAR
jgi:hypothetical protein